MPANEIHVDVSMFFVGAMTIDNTTEKISEAAAMPAATSNRPTTFPTIKRNLCGSRISNARKVPPENSAATTAMNVTNTRKPANEAPTANACVAPPLPASCASVVPPRRELAIPAVFAEANTVRVVTTANTSAAASATSTVRRRTSRISSALMIRFIAHLQQQATDSGLRASYVAERVRRARCPRRTRRGSPAQRRRLHSRRRSPADGHHPNERADHEM